jgi:hypothetical protein
LFVDATMLSAPLLKPRFPLDEKKIARIFWISRS